MSRARITFLFDKAMRKEITQEERLELYELLSDNSSKKVVEDLFLQARLSFEHGKTFFNEEESSQMIHKVLGGKEQPTNNTRRVDVLKWLVAAIVLITFSVGALFYYDRKPSHIQPVTYAEKDAIKSVRNQATLLLGDGSLVDLEAIDNKTVKEGDITISKTKDGQLVYHAAKANPTGEIKQNILSTPRGGQFQVQLPDGTHVWLGPSSSLSYPTRFEGAKREVRLEGEAYLEIAKNKEMPFEVQTVDATIHVMGTNFLISAYEDMEEITTTLVEGKVRVSAKDNSSRTPTAKILNPGQQARINKQTKAISLKNVNLEDALAWKNGYFVFHGDDIQQVMKTIARWYDVDVTYQGDLTGETFIGTVSKFDRIEKLLQTIELTGGVHFKTEGRKVIVMK